MLPGDDDVRRAADQRQHEDADGGGEPAPAPAGTLAPRRPGHDERD
jgi:hypothetical protein